MNKWKYYARLGLWVAAVVLVAVQVVHHLQTHAPAWRFGLDALLGILFISNTMRAWRQLRAASTTENNMGS